MEEWTWVWKWETGSRPIAFCQNQAWWFLHTGLLLDQIHLAKTWPGCPDQIRRASFAQYDPGLLWKYRTKKYRTKKYRTKSDVGSDNLVWIIQLGFILAFWPCFIRAFFVSLSWPPCVLLPYSFMSCWLRQPFFPAGFGGQKLIYCMWMVSKAVFFPIERTWNFCC